MLSVKSYSLVVLLCLFRLSKTERRIVAGREVETEKGYVIYLSKAPKSPQQYDFWLCGGSLVSTLYIVTSAACVEDIEYMYAIAGYKKYVPYPELEVDQCTKEMKKKVVFTCVPKMYTLDYANVAIWSYIDIAVVKVESEFNFEDPRFKSLCSYQPKAIEINFNVKYQEPSTDAIVLGWGHAEKWRKPEDTADYNQKTLHYAATRIHDKQECKQSFASVPGLDKVIDKYMICTLEAGNIDEHGDQIIKAKPLADGCTPNLKMMKLGAIECEEDEIMLDETRRGVFARILERQQNRTRKEGICQNDHGGPLVTWVGSHEVLIGVASVFRVTEDSRCTGPYLYTSTQCNGAFLDCVINSQQTDARRQFCNSPPQEKGFQMIKRDISWMHHPDGPAENEVYKMRPQKPISVYN